MRAVVLSGFSCDTGYPYKFMFDILELLPHLRITLIFCIPLQQSINLIIVCF